MEILNERPKDMSFEVYRQKLKVQKAKLILRLKRGFMVYQVTEGIVDDKGNITKFHRIRDSFRGRVKDIKFKLSK